MQYETKTHKIWLSQTGSAWFIETISQAVSVF